MMRECPFFSQQKQLQFLDNFGSNITSALSSFHDYRQVNSHILQLANVLIERSPGLTFEDKLSSVDDTVLSIYEASKFLDEKPTVATLLADRSWLLDSRVCSSFSVYSMVRKYVQIHRHRARRKRVDISLTGPSYREVVANDRAPGIVIHTLLDNAVKYAPSDTPVEIVITDLDDGSVRVGVSSFGPKILVDEEHQIFTPFFRGSKAREFADEGSGYGLYVSQLIAGEHFGSELAFRQGRAGPRESFWTTFVWDIPAVARVCRRD